MHATGGEAAPGREIDFSTIYGIIVGQIFNVNPDEIMSLESDIAGLLADRNDDWITPYEFERGVAHALARRVRKEHSQLRCFLAPFYAVYMFLSAWKYFAGPFFAFHFLVPLTPLVNAPEVFGFGTTVWFFTVLPLSLLFSVAAGLTIVPALLETVGKIGDKVAACWRLTFSRKP
jgi:hypothetical protein